MIVKTENLQEWYTLMWSMYYEAALNLTTTDVR